MSDVKVSIDAIMNTCRARDTAIADRDAFRERAITAEQERDMWKEKFLSERARHDEDGLALARTMRERTEWRLTCLAAEQERDRLRREVEALRRVVLPFSYAAESVADALRDIAGDAHEEYLEEYRYTAAQLDAILRGES